MQLLFCGRETHEPTEPRRPAGIGAMLFFALLGCFIFHSAPSLCDAVQGERTYAFTADESVAVVTISSSGGMTRGRSKYELFGDGRLVSVPRHPEEPTRESRLTYTETDEIVGALVNGGIMDWDRGDVARRIRQAGATTAWTDLPTVTVTVVLDHYQESGKEKEPRREISYRWSPALIKRSAPDARIPEVEALAFVNARFRAHFSESGE